MDTETAGAFLLIVAGVTVANLLSNLIVNYIANKKDDDYFGF